MLVLDLVRNIEFAHSLRWRWRWRWRVGLATSFIGAVLAGCAGPRFSDTLVLGESSDHVVVVAGEGESYAHLAQRYLGDAHEAWRIEDANDNVPIRPGMQVVIRKFDANRVGVFPDGYQVVPILSYHRFGENKGRLSVSRRQFTEQLEVLRDEGYRPVSLADVAAFLRAERALPRKAIVLTIDDGYQSVYKVAFPVLKKFGFPATVFIYTDYIANGGLTWSQMKEMEDSGLISFQAHSKTHDNLTVRPSTESVDEYKARLVEEVKEPNRKLQGRMSDPVIGYAYPFGAVNRPLVDELRDQGYELAATVQRGSNPFFAFPYALRRIMIYKADDLSEFKQALKTFEVQTLR